MTDDKKIEINNEKEEIQEIVEKCNSCGLCKASDSVFRAVKEEACSSRGRAVLFSKNLYESRIFDDCLAGTCRESCPFNIDIDNAIRKARKILNLRNKEHPKNKEIVNKILNKKNPFEN